MHVQWICYDLSTQKLHYTTAALRCDTLPYFDSSRTLVYLRETNNYIIVEHVERFIYQSLWYSD